MAAAVPPASLISLTTESAAAQRWFDRGLALCYAFNHEEAVRCFERAIKADPQCAMAHWGVAYALGKSVAAKALEQGIKSMVFDRNGYLYHGRVAALARGERVELRGFGAFSVKNRPARIGRNPRTGDKVVVAEKYVPFFKTGKEMRERLNSGSA